MTNGYAGKSVKPPMNKQAQQVGGQGNVYRDIQALNASILILTQKMNYVVRNEKILGRNLMVLNKKIKVIEQRGFAPLEKASEGGGGVDGAEYSHWLASGASHVSVKPKNSFYLILIWLKY